MSDTRHSGYAQDDKSLPVVTFRLGDEHYCLDILKIKEIIKTCPITRLPRQPEFVEGVSNLRGNVVPIIDLRKRLGIKPMATEKSRKIIIVFFEKHLVGFIVDAVDEHMKIPMSKIKSSADVLSGRSTEFIRGLIERDDDTLLMLLDPVKVLDVSQQNTLSSMVESHEV